MREILADARAKQGRARAKRSLLARTAAAALVMPFSVTGALAQTAVTPSPVQSQTADSEETVGDIIVTAQRRSERLQDVPIAVNVLDASQLGNSGISDIGQLSAVVPGLNIQQTLGSFQPSIRGISTSSNVVENAVALYIDGVYLPNQRDGARDLADVEQIAVLKGPQGTLFGRNATAGVIQITTRAPSHDAKGEVRVGYDNYQTLKGSAYLTGGLSSNIAASLSASYATQGKGWGRSLVNGMDVYKLDHSFSLRGKLQGEFGEGTRILLIGDYQNRVDTGRSYQPYPGTTFAYPGFGPVKSRYDSYSTTPGNSRFTGGGVSLEVDQDAGSLKFVSITSYRKAGGGFRFDFTGVAIPYVVSTGDLRNEDYSQEFQLLSTAPSKLQFVGGLYLFHNRIAYPNFPRAITQPFAPIPTVSLINSHAAEITQSVAPFAQLDYEIASGTKLTLGGRLTYEKREIRGFNTTTLVNGVTIIQPAVTPNTLQSDKPTWRIALNHNFDRDVSAYASYSRGLKSGGFNVATPQAAAYKEEVLDAFEIGLKSQLLDHKLRFNASGFLYKYQNIQVLTFAGGATTPILTNGAKAEMYGMDADFFGKVSDSLSLSGGLQLMHSTFTSYPSAPISSPKAGGGAAIVNGSATGNRLPLAQGFVGTLAVDYTKALGGIRGHLNVTGTYNGDYYFEPDNFLRQPSYINLNSSLRFSDLAEKYSLTFLVTNILDEAVIANIGTQPYAYYANYGFAPRVYSITVGVKF